MPTGDPNCPPEVRQAKRIFYKQLNRSEIGNGNDEFDLTTRQITSPDIEAALTSLTDAGRPSGENSISENTEDSVGVNVQNSTQLSNTHLPPNLPPSGVTATVLNKRPITPATTTNNIAERPATNTNNIADRAIVNASTPLA